MSRICLLGCCFVGCFITSECLAQVPTASLNEGTVIASKLLVPEYPAMARIARVQGDVDVMLEIGSNGQVQSATVVSGPALLVLRQAVLNSAKLSQFECRRCSSTVPYQLRYSFKVVEEDPPKTLEDCDATLHAAPRPAEVDLGQHQVTVFAEPVWICDPAATIRKTRTGKCLYLWRCGTREE